jgi:hypothetical protein
MQAKNHPLPSYLNVLTHYRKEKRYEIEPNSEFPQVCCLHGSSNWTQWQSVSVVVRRFPVSDGSGSRHFHPKSI